MPTSTIRNDILRAKGILPPKEEESKEALEDIYVEALNARKQEEASLENKTLDELDELEDELEDDRIIMEYRYVHQRRTVKLILKRRKRMQEMQQQAEKDKYGEVTQISKPDFVKEVTEASKECYVVVHLFKD